MIKYYTFSDKKKKEYAVIDVTVKDVELLYIKEVAKVGVNQSVVESKALDTNADAKI